MCLTSLMFDCWAHFMCLQNELVAPVSRNKITESKMVQSDLRNITLRIRLYTKATPAPQGKESQAQNRPSLKQFSRMPETEQYIHVSPRS